MQRKMISAVELYNSEFSNRDRYLEDAIFEEAKELIIEQLNSPDLKVEKITKGYEKYYKIQIVLAKTPTKSNPIMESMKGVKEPFYIPGIGEYKRWAVLGIFNKEKFPMNRLNDWLKEFGWTLEIYGDEDYFQVILISQEFETNVLNEKYWKTKIAFWPKYMQ